MINCTFEDGGKALRGLRHVTIGAIAVNQDKQVLLVKRAINMHNGGKYTIPGGFLDRNENIAQGVLRELKEETGYDGEIVCLFRVNDNPNRPKEDRQNVDVIYIVEITSEEVKHDHEVSKVEWFDESNLPPEEEFAFDHRDSIVRYFEYLEKPFNLPIIG